MGKHKGKEYTAAPKRKIKAKVSSVIKRKFEGKCKIKNGGMLLHDYQ